MRFAAAILGNVLMWSQVTIYQNYAEGQAKWGLTAVADQSIAGVIMMIEGTFLLIGSDRVQLLPAARQSIRKQELLDLAYLEGYSLDEERAERAVRAGHGDLLEKRIRAGGRPKAGPDPTAEPARHAVPGERRDRRPPGRPAAVMSGSRAGPPIERAPFRAWLVTGPVGRLTGFLIEFAAALWALRR